jgi:hypothetical protein
MDQFASQHVEKKTRSKLISKPAMKEMRPRTKVEVDMRGLSGRVHFADEEDFSIPSHAGLQQTKPSRAVNKSP